MHGIIIRDENRRDGRVFQAEGAVALFAEEMDVDVVVLAVTMAVAEFVAHAVAGIVLTLSLFHLFPENRPLA